jgi:hypothetical protein
MFDCVKRKLLLVRVQEKVINFSQLKLGHIELSELRVLSQAVTLCANLPLMTFRSSVLPFNLREAETITG